jgi:RNA recognition motif-containing protein
VDPDKLETMSSFEEVEEESSSTKEERTIFLTQLIQRTTVRDVRHYFHYILRLPIVEDSVIFLQHGNTGRHRGMAYVTLKYRRDVPRALEYSNRVPDWQRFPIQIRLCGITTSVASVVTSADGGMSTTGSTNTASNAANYNPTIGIANSSNIQQVYVGNLERVVTSEQVEYLFSQFGTVSKVSLQVDALTNVSKGFAFVSYAGDSTAKDANLAIQTMQGQLLAGRPMKTGWATVHSADAETSMEFPEDAAVKVQKANVALQQLSGNGLSALASLGIIEDPTSTAIDTATGTDDVTHTNTTNSAPLTKVVQIEHMYDPSIDDIQDETTYKELVEELREELMRLHPDLIIQEIICYNIDHTTITSSSNDNTNNKRVGCMKVALETEEMAMRCLQSLQGRFFDGRKLQVTYV